MAFPSRDMAPEVATFPDPFASPFDAAQSSVEKTGVLYPAWDVLYCGHSILTPTGFPHIHLGQLAWFKAGDVPFAPARGNGGNKQDSCFRLLVTDLAYDRQGTHKSRY